MGVTHPQPLSRGEFWDAALFLVMSGLWCLDSPLGEGMKGYCFSFGMGLGSCSVERDELAFLAPDTELLGIVKGVHAVAGVDAFDEVYLAVVF